MEPGARQTEVLLILVKVLVGCEERRAEGRTEGQEESGLEGQYSCQGLGGAPCLCLQGCWGDKRTGTAACRVWVLVGGAVLTAAKPQSTVLFHSAGLCALSAEASRDTEQGRPWGTH